MIMMFVTEPIIYIVFPCNLVQWNLLVTAYVLFISFLLPTQLRKLEMGHHMSTTALLFLLLPIKLYST